MLVKEVKKTKNYEMAIALKPLLPDDVRKAMHKDFVELVKSMGGEVIDVDVWGKRYLAYKIKTHNEGYYIIYTFVSDPSNISELKRLMALKQEVLRFMIVEVDNVDDLAKKIKKKEIEI